MITGGTKQYKKRIGVVGNVGIIGASDTAKTFAELEILKKHLEPNDSNNIEIVVINPELILSNDTIDNTKNTIDPNNIPITKTKFEITPIYQYSDLIKSGKEKRRERRKNDRRNNKNSH